MPDNVQLQEVTINGKVQSIRQEGREVPLPISPGKQKIVLKWRSNKGIEVSYQIPEIDLGLPHVNSNIELRLPYNRWPLLVSGPMIGPAVLFYSVLIIIVLVSFGLARSGLTRLKFHQWFLLGIGMSQSNLSGAVLVGGWLIAIEYRKKLSPENRKIHFNMVQLGLAFLTFLALMSLIYAISRGLLGHPDMNIVGNGSGRGVLKWYQDYSENLLPQGWLLSIPMIYYRLAMLAWALWISFSLISILRYGWKAFSEPIIWQSVPKGGRKKRLFRSLKGKDGRGGEGIDISGDIKVEDDMKE